MELPKVLYVEACPLCLDKTTGPHDVQNVAEVFVSDEKSWEPFCGKHGVAKTRVVYHLQEDQSE